MLVCHQIKGELRRNGLWDSLLVVPRDGNLPQRSLSEECNRLKKNVGDRQAAQLNDRSLSP